ncbi:hypothetical protein ACRC6Q_16765 [Planococcus sp. SE5232]|uniref:hypothetical protein n=1 Tax=unclassified Planococcus (in: firmicutes) TaxID=2662419 RepID=UPI003D6C5BA8
MSVEVRGISEMLADLESRLGPEAVGRISDAALIEASLVFKESLTAQLSLFKDTGATIDELTFSEPKLVDGVRTITVYWKGPKRRYAVIHLNEFGTVKNPNPNGKGAIARALQQSERSYKQAIRNAIERGL